jgi:hypothetical protein
MIITVFIINESVQIVYYNVTKAKENKSSGSQTTSPPQNFGRWNVFIAIQKFFFKFTTKFKLSSVLVTRTSFDKRLNDWPIENESKNAAWLRVKTLSSSVLMYSYVPNKYYLK